MPAPTDATLPAVSHPPDLSAKLPRLTPRKPRKTSEPQTTPPPPTPPLPPPPSLENWTFVKPGRRILSPADHEKFLNSETYTLVTAFIFTLSDRVRDTPISSLKDAPLAPTVQKILHILEQAEEILQRHPPEDTGSRFGNPIFRKFVDEIATTLPEWHKDLGLQHSAQIEEVSIYLSHSFGNARRIDYGSGHELNFCLWLLCLNRLSLLPPPTFPSLVLVVFPAYLRLMRKIQSAYYLEPAGSHGVWGLDDYQFLPFLFGASQLVGHGFITPKSIHQALTLEEYGRDYLYLDQVSFVNSIKNVEGLRWHSPMLDDISSSKSWAKIEGGMRKMFVKEVLGKLPVMQHFLFGSLVPPAEGMSGEEEVREESEGEGEGGEVKVFKDEMGTRHVHDGKGWGDCCGIRVPGVMGAVGEEGKGRMGGLRRVPFD